MLVEIQPVSSLINPQSIWSLTIKMTKKVSLTRLTHLLMTCTENLILTNSKVRLISTVTPPSLISTQTMASMPSTQIWARNYSEPLKNFRVFNSISMPDLSIPSMEKDMILKCTLFITPKQPLMEIHSAVKLVRLGPLLLVSYSLLRTIPQG